MSWRKGGYQSFQIMWSTKLHSDCVPPLQVRSFTSDSYRAIKERERKRGQQKKAASQQCRTLLHTEARREFALLDGAVDALWTGTELDDAIHTSNSRSLQSVPQEGCRVQLDVGIQQNLPRFSAQPTGRSEFDCERTTRYLDPSTSDASSPTALGSTSPELVTDTELGSNYSQAVDPEQSSAFTYEVDMIVPNDGETPIEEPGSSPFHGTALASPTLSYSTPIHSCVAVCSTEPYELPMQDRDSASPRPVSLQPNTSPALADTTAASSNEFALVKSLLDIQGYACRDGHHEPLIYRGRLDQASGISEKRDTMPQALWTKDLDEYLLHLRNVAQLDWKDLIDYFPTMTRCAVKCRHKHLSETKDTAPDANYQISPGCEEPSTDANQHLVPRNERSTATLPPASTPSRRKPKVTKLSRATSGARVTCRPEKSASLSRQHRKARHFTNVEVKRSGLPASEGVPERSSRYGRTIRHPFRHRPQEGYL